MQLSEPNEADVRNAIFATLHRETAPGVLWFPRDRKTDKLAAVFLFRTRKLHGIIHQIVRLAHLMEQAGRKARSGGQHRPSQMPPYQNFLYLELSRLTSTQFRARIVAAKMKRLLDDRIMVNASEVRFLDSRFSAGASASEYSLGFNQMPEIAAGLDIVHNMLGFPVTRSILAPVLSDGMGDAPVVAENLFRQVLAWLRPRLDSEHIIKKTRVLRSWCGHTGITSAQDITPDLVRAFWCDVGSRMGKNSVEGPTLPILTDATTTTEESTHQTDEESPQGPDGFRLIGYASQAVLHYRDALRVAEAERSEARALSASPQGADAEASLPGEINLDRIETGSFSDWISGPGPLTLLMSAPACRIKWFPDTQIRFMWQALGSSADGVTAPEKSGPSLFADGWIDDEFYQTVLLVQSFHSLQNVVKSRNADFSAAKLSNPDYSSLAASYRNQFSIIVKTARATAYMLLQHLDTSGVALAAKLEPQIVRQILFGQDDNVHTSADAAELAAINERKVAVMAAQAASGLTALGKILKTEGFDKVARADFKTFDPTDERQREALVAGAEGLEALIGEFLKLIRWLESNDLDALYAKDAATVLHRLRDMYGAAG